MQDHVPLGIGGLAERSTREVRVREAAEIGRTGIRGARTRLDDRPMTAAAFRRAVHRLMSSAGSLMECLLSLWNGGNGPGNRAYCLSSSSEDVAPRAEDADSRVVDADSRLGRCGLPGGRCGPPGGRCGLSGGRCGPPDGRCGPPGGRCGLPGGRCGPPGGRCGPPDGRCGPPDERCAWNS
jgi:hypothetical protein